MEPPVTELTRQDQIKLAPLRAAIRGWQFSENKQSYLRAAEREIALLPDRLQPTGLRLLLPLRSAVPKTK